MMVEAVEVRLVELSLAQPDLREKKNPTCYHNNSIRIRILHQSNLERRGTSSVSRPPLCVLRCDVYVCVGEREREVVIRMDRLQYYNKTTA
jgi:hypothetical protein